MSDQQIDWCRAQGFKICGGPLLKIDRWSLPDWMYLWGEDDAESFHLVRGRAYSGRRRALSRAKSSSGIVPSRLNIEQRFLLQRGTAAAVGGAGDRDHPPCRSASSGRGHGRSALGLVHEPRGLRSVAAAFCRRAGAGRLGPGRHRPGNQPRLQPRTGPSRATCSSSAGRWIAGARWGCRCWSSLTVPSGSGKRSASPHRKSNPLSYAEADELSIATQRAWAEKFLPVLLAKQPVQGIIWNQLLDSQPHALAHGGLFDAQDRPKPILELLAVAAPRAPDVKVVASTRHEAGSTGRSSAETGQAHVVALRAAADEALDVVENQPAQAPRPAPTGVASWSSQPLQAVELAGGVHRFADAVGEQGQRIARHELARVLLVVKVGVDAQRQAGLRRCRSAPPFPGCGAKAAACGRR